jgi:hypothetical protein
MGLRHPSGPAAFAAPTSTGNSRPAVRQPLPAADSVESAPLSITDSFTKVLGEGGNGIVFAAQWHNGEKAAVKCSLPHSFHAMQVRLPPASVAIQGHTALPIANQVAINAVYQLHTQSSNR